MARDRERGSTSYGPHRFDVLLRLDGHPARELVSRGQQKVIGSAMALTMTRYVAEVAGRAPTCCWTTRRRSSIASIPRRC
jgi:DNA replication and repair protein RecF